MQRVLIRLGRQKGYMATLKRNNEKNTGQGKQFETKNIYRVSHRLCPTVTNGPLLAHALKYSHSLLCACLSHNFQFDP